MSANGIRDFRDLHVWPRAIQFAKSAYVLSRRFPNEEQFGLTSQLRRAAVSGSSNIAEGHSRQGREFAHSLSVARGSLAECESQLHLGAIKSAVRYSNSTAALGLAAEIHKMAATLVSRLPS